MAIILVVDDDADALESLGLLLGLMGHRVAAFPDAPSAVAGVAKHPTQFDFALVDIGLPGTDRCELVRHLKAAPQAASAVFVALTGLDDQSGRAAEAGFGHILIKPIQLTRLQALLGEPPRA